MAFYTDLSETYDALFPVSAAQRALFDEILAEGVTRAVDAGCGTGAQLLHFASAGVPCEGFDPDPALVSLARRKLAGLPARVFVGGFSDMARLVSPGADLVLCLGNSLVHVPQEEAGRFLADAFALLAPGGRLLLQILNYDRIRRAGVSELPLLRAQDGAVEFRRRYEWVDARTVRFVTSLRIESGDGPRILRNDIPLYPLDPDLLFAMLERAGYRPVRFFGDFARAEFTPESEAVVCLARKT